MTNLPKPKLPETKSDIVYAPKTARVFDGMPAYLKEPKNYQKIQKMVLETLAGKCSHGEVVEWAACDKCQKRFAERGQIIKKLGFRSMAQYMAWQQVHQEIKTRMPLDKYNKMITSNIQI